MNGSTFPNPLCVRFGEGRIESALALRQTLDEAIVEMSNHSLTGGEAVPSNGAVAQKCDTK